MTPLAKSRPSKEMIQPVITALKQALGDDFIALVLFGSQARGQATPASDWDLLLIARSRPLKHLSRHLFLKKLLPESHRGAVTMIAKTPEEFEAALPPLYLDIALDGIILHDTNHYLVVRLNQLRRFIQAQGLYREQIGNDLMWRWREFPGLDWSITWETLS
jgi:predicted nucleotidyltransferase